MENDRSRTSSTHIIRIIITISLFVFPIIFPFFFFCPWNTRFLFSPSSSSSLRYFSIPSHTVRANIARVYCSHGHAFDYFTCAEHTNAHPRVTARARPKRIINHRHDVHYNMMYTYNIRVFIYIRTYNNKRLFPILYEHTRFYTCVYISTRCIAVLSRSRLNE